jgi:N-carbamoyl-L-amino-acid hydrolase
MFGSQAVSGQLSPEWIHTARDASGKGLREAMAEYHLDAMEALSAARPPQSMHAYIELHIEQGPVLDEAGATIGIVDGVCGLRRWEVRLTGVANHAGTTPMSMRTDAFQGLAEFSSEIDRVLEEHGTPLSVATIGRVSLSPGAANVVPGEACFSLEFRDLDSVVLDELGDAFRRTLSAIARRRKLMFNFQVISDLAPVQCDRSILSQSETIAKQFHYTTHRLPSGAAHDAQQLAGITRTAMVFVPSKGGRSHSAAEWTAWSDIQAGANVLLNILHQLANEISP